MEAGKIQISGIFQNGRLLEIPFYQRAYVWGEVQWNRFLEDMAFITSTKKPFFFGSIILKDGKIPGSWEDTSSRKIVTDGQQRLTTLMIFMKVLALKNNNLSVFNSLFLIGGSECKYVLAHGKYDADAFRQIMNLKTDQALANPEPQSQIIAAYEYFRENLKAEYYNWNVIKQNVLFVCIDIQENEDEQQIFDTINSPGVSLSISELLKNYFFTKEELEAYERDWVQVFEADEDCRAYWQQEIETGRKKRSLIDVFFDAYFQILVSDRSFAVRTEDKIAYSRIDRLAVSYKEFISTYCNGDKQMVIGKLARYAGCFVRAIHPDAVKSCVPATPCIERINIIMFGLNNTTLIPYILFIECNVDDLAQRNKLYSVLEAYIMRRMVCHATTKNYNRMFGSLILNRVLSHEKLIDMLVSAEDSTDTTTYIPGDPELMDAFRNARLVNLQTRGILYLLESRIHLTMAATILLGFEGYSLEHLMPKKWRNNWPKCANEEQERKRDAALLTLGNLAIIPQVLNASIRDAQWSEKLHGKGGKTGLYACAIGLSTMQEVLHAAIWNEQAINERANWLFEQARRIWSIEGLPSTPSDPEPQQPKGKDDDGHTDELLTAYDVKNMEYVDVHTVGEKFIAEYGGHAEGYQTCSYLSSMPSVRAFLILKGSTVTMKPTPKCPQYVLNLRQNCKGVLTGNVINKNLLFTSASMAACFVCFSSVNGNRIWKSNDLVSSLIE